MLEKLMAGISEPPPKQMGAQIFHNFWSKNIWSCSKGLKCRNRQQMANEYKHSLSSTIQPVSPNGTPSVGRWHMAYVIIGLCWVMGRFTLYPTQRFIQNNQNGEVYVHHHHPVEDSPCSPSAAAYWHSLATLFPAATQTLQCMSKSQVVELHEVSTQ